MMAVNLARRLNRGMTLLELMVSSAVLALMMVYILEAFTAYHHHGEVISHVTESQQSMRAVADLMESDIRHAGFMVPTSAAFCGVDSQSSSDVLYVSDADAIDHTNLLVNNLGSSFVGSNVASGANTLELDLILEPSGDAAYDTNADGTPDSDFRPGAGVIIIDSGNPDRGSACGIVVSVDVGGEKIVVNLQSDILGTSPGTGVNLIAIPAHVYSIDSNFTLARDGMSLAAGVEDLQAAYFFDDNGNRRIDAGEYRGDGTGDDFNPKDLDAANAREIRMSFVTRTRLPDAKFTGGRFQSAENRDVVAGNDGFRRRVHTSTVLLRNILIREVDDS
jgi:prepilin-type N-terminal cleavage/methylation domain-containing protein